MQAMHRRECAPTVTVRTISDVDFERDVTRRNDGLPRGDDDRLGVAIYDLQAPGPNQAPFGSYPMEATQMALRVRTRMLLLAGPTGVSTLESILGVCAH